MAALLLLKPQEAGTGPPKSSRRVSGRCDSYRTTAGAITAEMRDPLLRGTPGGTGTGWRIFRGREGKDTRYGEQQAALLGWALANDRDVPPSIPVVLQH